MTTLLRVVFVSTLWLNQTKLHSEPVPSQSSSQLFLPPLIESVLVAPCPSLSSAFWLSAHGKEERDPSVLARRLAYEKHITDAVDANPELKNACNKFVAAIAKSYFGYTQFLKQEGQATRALRANEIYDYVSAPETGWVKIGSFEIDAKEPSLLQNVRVVLQMASMYANRGYFVLAARRSKLPPLPPLAPPTLENIGTGHVALVLPGNLQASTDWGFPGQHTVPNSASSFQDEPEKHYIGKPLSYAFMRAYTKYAAIFVHRPYIPPPAVRVPANTSTTIVTATGNSPSNSSSSSSSSSPSSSGSSVVAPSGAEVKISVDLGESQSVNSAK